MSDCWIESHTRLRRHPKLKRLARALGVGEVHAIGILHALWWFAAEYAPDGDLERFSPEELAEECELPDGNALRNALLTTGWCDAPFRLHDWDEYYGRMRALQEHKRAANRDRQRRYRERLQARNQAASQREVQSERNALRHDDARVTTVLRNALVTPLPNLTEPNLTEPNLTRPDLTGPDITEPKVTESELPLREGVLCAENAQTQTTENALVTLDAVSASASTTRSRTRATFKAPTLDECKDYAKAIGATDYTAEAFHDYFTANGWRVGRNPMKDWRAALRNWWRRDCQATTRARNGPRPETLQDIQRRMHMTLKELGYGDES